MIDNLDEFIGILARAGLEPTLEETRDALWLSTHIVVAETAVAARAPLVKPPAEVPATTVRTPEGDAGEAPSGVDVASGSGSTELYAGGGESAGSMRGVAARSPAVPALRHKAAVARALRPLKRSCPSTTTFVVDENATAEQVAAEGLWLPVLRPAAEKWLDLTLVIDTGPSMVIWRRTLAEFRTLTERLGAFRRIRVVELDGDDEGPLSVASEGAAGASRTNPATLVDPAQRQVILVITDGVGHAWREGLIQPYVRQWAQHGSVAVATVLPQRMWVGAGLKVAAGQAWSARPGVPNLQWRTRGGGGVPVPVLGLSARWLKPWAQLVAGYGGQHNTALLADQTPDPVTAHHKPATLSPEEIVGTFRAAASPTAFQLACYLSAAWLNLAVMRLVQHLMLPDSDVSHLAEVFLGGLVHRVGGDGDPDTAQYEFTPGVRDELNHYLSREELLTVLQRSSEFVAERFGQSFDFAALLADPDGVDLPAVVGDVGGRPLAVVSAGVLAKLGGRYQTLAQRLASRPVPAASAATAAPTVETAATAGETSSAPLPTTADHPRSTVGGFFLGVAVERYQELPNLQASRGTQQLAQLLGRSYMSEFLPSPTRAQAEESLLRLRASVPAGRSLVVLWEGHFVTGPNGPLRLITADDHGTWNVGVDAQFLIDACIQSGARQILVILDGADPRALDQLRLDYGTVEWLGVFAAARTGGAAGDDFLGEVLSGVAAGLPKFIQAITGDALLQNIFRQARQLGNSRHCAYRTVGNPRPMVLNPMFRGFVDDPGARADATYNAVRELLRAGNLKRAESAARAITDIDERSRALADIVGALADSGDIDGAVEVAPTITIDRHRVAALAAIAVQKARSGDKRAAEFLDDAQDLANSIADPKLRTEAMRLVAQAAGVVHQDAPLQRLSGTRVLISFAHADSQQVMGLSRLLKNEGAQVVTSQGLGLRPGDRWDDSFVREIERADVAVVVFSNLSVASKQHGREVDLLRRSRLSIVPVVLGGASRSDFLFLVEFQHLSALFIDQVSDTSVEPLIKAIAAGSTDRPDSQQESDSAAGRKSVSEADQQIPRPDHTGSTAGEPRDRVMELRALLEEQLRVLGPDDPRTLHTRENLASAWAQSGDFAGAATELELLLGVRTTVQGRNHRDTLNTRGHLANLRARAGDFQRAESELQALLEDQTRLLGPDDRDTAATRQSLVNVRAQGGEALPIPRQERVGVTLSGRYRLQRLIATGGTGQVWEAVDSRIGRRVAVKILKAEFSSDPEFVERFRAEARTTAMLNHPGIASTYDYGETEMDGEGRTAYLVMELVNGEPLNSVLERVGRLSLRHALDMLEQTGRALQVAHSAGLVHRDVRPGNILITPTGQVKLTDFGIAKAVDAAPITQPGMVMGAAEYIAPEQALGHDTTPASDVYSLGVVAYESVSGKRPFTGDGALTIAMKHIKEIPPPLPAELPPNVRELIEITLVKNPGMRYSSGGQFADAVAVVRAGRRPPRPQPA